MSLFLALLTSLPDIIKLLQVLQGMIDKERAASGEAAVNRKVADDIRTIHEAFNAKDPNKLNALFANK